MKFLRSEQRVRNGYFGAFALLILIYAFVFFSMLQMAKRFGGMDRGYNVIWNLKLLTSYLNQADATFKNYAKDNKKAYLDSISIIEDKADSVILVLNLLKPNSKEESRTDTLRRLVQNRV